MNSIVNLMGKYDHRQHELSDWLLELEQRFQLGQVDTDRAKITWCQLLIGATGSSILASLEDGATWEAAKETLLSRLGAGSVRDEAWASLKQLKRGSKEIIELASEAEKLAKRLHPRNEEAAERQAVDAFLSALDQPLAAEVRKLGHNNMEEVVAATRRIERILQERPTPRIGTLMESMNRQIQFLTKDLARAQDKIAAQPPVATPTAALAVPPSQAVAATQHPPASLAPPRMAHPAATPLQPMATARPPPYSPGPSQYFSTGNDGAPYFRSPRRRSDRGPLRCFLCDEEGHVAYRCPARTLLQRMLQQQAPEPTREPPRGQILARSPQPKVTQIGCTVGPPISGQLIIEGVPVLGLVDTGASITCLGFDVWWRYHTQWGALKPYGNTVRGAHGKPLNIAGRTEHLDIQWGEARGRASFIVIVGLESPPCLIGMDIMRPLRVHIDVTNGTATPAQPDPQTIHLNAAQRQQPQKRLPAPTTSPPPQLQPLRENPASAASLLTERTAEPSSSQLQRQKNPLAESRSSALPSSANPPPTTAGDLPSAPASHALPNLANPHTASCARLLQKADIPCPLPQPMAHRGRLVLP